MPLLEMQNICKSFGAANVLKGVHLTVEEGEVHALLGENGAGKSTLMNILTGVYTSDAGTITFQGKTYINPSIQEMEEAGIAFVHQELNVINDLTVADNIFLCKEIRKFGIIDKKEQIKRAKELFESLGVKMNPSVLVSTLKTSEKQLLEICRALYADAKLIILDEPTTALSNDEISHLFGILKSLKKQGKSFIFISHKMPEIFEISDRYTVFRNGEFISSGNISETTPHDITTDMVGEKYVDKDLYESRKLGDTILKLNGFTGPGFTDINLEAKSGEIIAVTGLAGCGSSEFLQAMFGAIPYEGGGIEVKGKKPNGAIKKFMKKSIAMLPANRRENSDIPDQTILENFYVAEHSISKKPFISKSEEEKKYRQVTEENSIKVKIGALDDLIDTLSGGNKQKVYLARWLNTGADLVLFDNPTQGVDVGAKEDIYKLILSFAEQGKTVIFFTLEIPEIKKIADRCLVFYEGQIVKEFTHEQVNEHDVMLYATNAI